MSLPSTLVEAVRCLSDPEARLEFVTSLVWPSRKTERKPAQFKRFERFARAILKPARKPKSK
jgi:hypothetical protein